MRATIFAAAIVMAASLLVLSYAFKETWYSSRFANVLSIAQDVDTYGSVPNETLLASMDSLSEIVDDNVCRSDIVKAGMSLVLKDLDYRYQLQEIASRSNGLIFAERYLRHALKCLPVDGNVWLRFAMVRYARTSNLEELAHSISLSQQLAPAEENIILGRFALWNSAPAQLQQKAAAAYNADKNAVCGSRWNLVRKQLPDLCPKTS